MSKITRIRNNLLPPLLPSFYKGQLGKLAVIGGCEDYTGAPYFSAHSAMLSGVDLVHIICEQSAASVIKGYSPDLMVHPYILDSNSMNSKFSSPPKMKSLIDEQMQKITGLVNRMDVIIIGPGFGRNDHLMNEFLFTIIEYILQKSDKHDIPIILDADALYHLSINKDLQNLLKESKNPNIILTPNIIEFNRLTESFNTDNDLKQLSKVLNCTIVQKGMVDKICYHGNEIIVCDINGSLKRVGGQGDSLTGMIGAFLCWGMGAYKKGLYNTIDKLNDEEIISLSCLGGCTTTRMAGKMAYDKYGRAMLTSNLHEFISKAFADLED